MNRQNQRTFSTQGAIVGWILWCLSCLTPLLLCQSVEAHAGTFSPLQTTFAAVAVGQTSAPVLVTLTPQASGTATAPIVVTGGVTTATLEEFTVTNGGTCGTNPNLSSGQSCTVTVTFSPRFPGVRQGAVLLESSSGQLLASALISGMGQGSLPVLIPGQMETVAGDGQWFYQGDNVPATQAPIYLPSALAVDGAGDLYLADTINNRVRRVDAVTHIIVTVAGNGSAGDSGDGGPAISAEITNPSGLALDGAGNLYIADTGNNAIRRVDAVSGTITTVAGMLGQPGYTGDGNPAISAKLNGPQGLAITASGDLLIADTTNAVIRAVTASDGKIQTIAGTGTAGYSGDGILATTAQLSDPSDVAIRGDGAIAIADLSNNRVRLFTVGGNIATIAGNGTAGFSGDYGSATQAELQGPAAVTFDPAGDLFIADSVNNCIRLVYASQNEIVSLAGFPTDDRFYGDGGPENYATMHGPDGLAFDAQGNLWLSDRFNNRVREVTGSFLTVGPYPTMKVGKISQPTPEAMLNAGNQPLTLYSPVLQQAALDESTTTCGSSTLAASLTCSMGVEFAPTNVGASVTGSITWNSNAPNVTPVDSLYGEVLSVEPTTTVITSSVNPGLVNQPVMLTATVSSDATSVTGTVNFIEGSQTWCSDVALGASRTATCTIQSLSLGAHVFAANYSGDNSDAASTSAAFTETIKEQAALALSVSTSPSVVTSNGVLTISVADASGIPTGTVVFYDGTTALATVALDGNGNASWSTTNFTVGSHTLTAQYSGDTYNVSGVSNARVLVINQGATTTVLSSGNNNATVGSNVMLTANVVSNNGLTPTGSVQFFDGTTSLGSSTLLSSGLASIMISMLAPGTHNLTAVYSGDTDSATSTSAPIAQVIQQINTATTLGANADPVNARATLQLTAIVTMAPGTPADSALSGIVTFRYGTTVLGSASINATGQATLALNSLSVGAYNIVAGFSGNTIYAPSNSATLNEIVQQTATATTLGSASSTTLMGKPATFTVAVSSGTGTPTGTVIFKDGATVLGMATLNVNGDATFTTTGLSAGNHTITAVYDGDANDSSSTSQALQQTVNLALTTLSLSGPTNTVDAGTLVQFVAALATPGVTPTGTVTLLDGSAGIGTLPVTAAGSFNFTNSQLSLGTHHITAKYSGDANDAAVTSSPIVVTVQQASTVTALTSSVNPLIQGSSLTLTAIVTSDSPNEGGTVSFYNGSSLLGTVSLTANGTSTFSTQTLALGSQYLTAIYSGDTNHAGSTSATLAELVVQNSLMTVSSSVNPSVSGQTVTFTAQLQGSPIPTGSVLIKDNRSVLATVPLNASGLANLATANLSVGTHSIAFTYSGDSHFSGATGQVSQSVIEASTRTTLTSSANPAIYGQPLSLSATVVSNGGAATGTVNLTDGSVVIGSAQSNANGNAVFTLSTLTPGTHALAAVYVGNGDAGPSASASLALTVKQSTALALSSNANPALTLSQVNLTATLTDARAAVATGSVSFTDGSTKIGTAALDSTGHATLSVPQMTAGTHTILASYVGDGSDFPSQSAAFSQVVQVRPTTTAVTGTSTDAANPQQVTLIAVVSGSGSVPPSGMVTFASGDLALGAAAVGATGVATITVIFDTTSQKVVASYSGDEAYASSQSGFTTITAGSPAAFTITPNISNITLVSHQHTTISVTVASVKEFTDEIALGCLGLPYAATCTFSNTQVQLAPNGTVTATLIVDTGDPLGAGSSTSASLHPKRVTLLCFLPAGLLLGGLLRKRRKRFPILLTLLFGLALATGPTGCGGLQMSGTPPGTYSFRIIGTGQDSNITEVQTVTMVVTQ